MASRVLVVLMWCVYLLTIQSVGMARSNTPDEIVAFVNKAIPELTSSSLGVSQFGSATIDTIEEFGKANNLDHYLCWLRDGRGRIGYMAVAGRKGSYHVLVFSATVAPPEYFLRHLKMPQLPQQSAHLTRAGQMTFVDKVPLVTAAPTVFGTETIEISEVAASVSTVCQYLQYVKEMLLFGHMGFFRDSKYFSHYKRSLDDVNKPTDPNWQSFSEEYHKILARENIPPGQASRAAAASRARMQKLIKPVVRRRLLRPASSKERLEVLRSEWNVLSSVTRYDISPGMKDAILLQQDYLRPDTAALRQDLDVFLATRGLTARVQALPCEKVPANTLPVILIGPDGVAGVMLGLVDFDDQRFAAVFLPRTSEPNTVMLAQRLGPRALPDPNEGKNDLAKEMLSRLRTSMEKTKVVSDQQSRWPDSLNHGVHVCRLSCLAHWQAIIIDQVELGDNWPTSSSQKQPLNPAVKGAEFEKR